ncbi:SpoIIE family protein phosphatase [Actinoplanes derwentensis]|uniref:Response regulator receiver domain-containing protein n=1 Tax=Actinoplanes derwentensis TaxID=113562 RepID=A0A1H1Z3F5_9ACTN|nr:SpoIIE family protein phosphatase [Actinoplanes derwentensis]GID81410.1 hypothetical protein Ade03nite_03340 [Actinoplanes derwentensis]SDT28143.1 Response regulator receiver domain-containing protein [Actinoplanes derwentensis]
MAEALNSLVRLVTRLAAFRTARYRSPQPDLSDELRRSRFLAGASGLVSSLPDVAGLSARLTRFCVPDVAAVAVMQQYDGKLATVGLAHRDPARQARLEELLASGPVAERALAEGETICARLEPGDVLADGLTRPWCIVAPIRSGGAVRGLLTWVADTGVTYGAADVLLATEFAHRVALAWQWAEVFAERGRIAAALQQSLLPGRMPPVAGLEIAARYVAADAALEVGGDFYDVFPATGGQWLAVIGDVMGRGVEAAGVTGLARHTLRAIGPGLELPESLQRLNGLLHENPDHDRFLTIAMVRLDIAAGRMTIVRGGHCPPILVPNSGPVQRIQPAGGLLGGFRNVRFAQVETGFAAGDALVLYTDGVIEARRGGEFFGEERLHRVLTAAAGSSAEEIADRILAAVADFAGTNTEDDMAVLVLRRPPMVAVTRPVLQQRRQPPLAVADRRVPVFSTVAVSRLTGIPAGDLTAWSERYGLIVPSRTRAGAAVWSGQQLDAARLVAGEMRRGHDEVAAHATLTEHLTSSDPPAFTEPAGSGTILVVDQDTYLLTVIDRNLRAAGFEVDTARTADQARTVLAGKPVACVLVDLLMPGGSVTDWCRDLVATGLPVLTYSSLRAVDKAFAAGAEAFLIKPLNAAGLISTVRDILTPTPAATPSPS